MQELPTTFVRVFNVNRVQVPWYSRGGVKQTTFTFEALDGKVHQATVLGHPRLEDEMSVIAVLAKSNDWQSLVGWVVQPTGEIAGSGLLNTSHVMVAMFAGAAGAVIAAMNGSWLVALGFGAVAALVVASINGGVKLDHQFKSIQRRVLQNAP